MARALVVVALMAAVFGMASAATYNVGEPEGSWDLQTDYMTWVSGKMFLTGDQLVFKYNPQQHDMLEVDKAAYDSCSTSNALTTHNSGNDVIILGAPGMRYFICGFPGHCDGGMKLQVNVMPAARSMAPAGAPGSSPRMPGTPGSTSGTPGTPGSSGSSAAPNKATGFGLAAAAMIAAGLMA